jgi:hypothetical protein
VDSNAYAGGSLASGDMSRRLIASFARQAPLGLSGLGSSPISLFSHSSRSHYLHCQRTPSATRGYASIAHTMSPSLSSKTPEADRPTTFGNFDHVKRFKLDFSDIEVSKWQSRVTGLSVVHMDYDGACCLTTCATLLTHHCLRSSSRQWLFYNWDGK